jgi:uncharacterized membrane protein YgcG
MKTKKPAPGTAGKGVPALVKVWLGWLVFWLGVSVMGIWVPPEKEAVAAPSKEGSLVAYVNDFAATLRPETVRALEASLAQFEADTSTQLAVALYPRLPHGAIEDFTIEVAERSRLGRKGLDNGAILYVFVEEHAVRLEVGYGLEGALTDIASHRILVDVFAPAWSAGKREEAVRNTLERVMATVRDEFKAGKAPSPVVLVWRQLVAETPRLLVRLPHVLVGVPIEARIVIALFGGLFMLGFADGFRQAVTLGRNAFVMSRNLRQGRALLWGTTRTSIESAIDSIKVLVIAACVIGGLIGIVLIAGGGAFGSAGATTRW